jgi:hypothetical protein
MEKKLNKAISRECHLGTNTTCFYIAKPSNDLNEQPPRLRDVQLVNVVVVSGFNKIEMFVF